MQQNSLCITRWQKEFEKIFESIKQALGQKKYSHDGMYKIAENKNRPMITIGGWFFKLVYIALLYTFNAFIIKFDKYKFRQFEIKCFLKLV